MTISAVHRALHDAGGSTIPEPLPVEPDPRPVPFQYPADGPLANLRQKLSELRFAVKLLMANLNGHKLPGGPPMPPPFPPGPPPIEPPFPPGPGTPPGCGMPPGLEPGCCPPGFGPPKQRPPLAPLPVPLPPTTVPVSSGDTIGKLADGSDLRVGSALQNHLDLASARAAAIDMSSAQGNVQLAIVESGGREPRGDGPQTADFVAIHYTVVELDTPVSADQIDSSGQKPPAPAVGWLVEGSRVTEVDRPERTH